MRKKQKPRIVRSEIVMSADEIERDWAELATGLPRYQELDVLNYAEAERKERQEREKARQREYDRSLR